MGLVGRGATDGSSGPFLDDSCLRASAGGGIGEYSSIAAGRNMNGFCSRWADAGSHFCGHARRGLVIFC